MVNKILEFKSATADRPEVLRAGQLSEQDIADILAAPRDVLRVYVPDNDKDNNFEKEQ